MANRLREAFVRLCARVWRGGHRLAADPEHGGESRRRTEARARFWSEFREGQREADAHRSRQVNPNEEEEPAMGDRSPKSKQRDQKQKNAAKAADAAAAKSKQETQSHLPIGKARRP